MKKKQDRYKFCPHCKYKQFVFDLPFRSNRCERCDNYELFDKWSDVPPRGVPPTPTSATPLPLAHLFDYRLMVTLFIK